MPEDRRLAAIMFTDIVGYTALMGTDEEKAFQILRKNREIHKPLIKKYRGKWLKEMGDGILASFHTSSDAVRCAGEIQHEAKKADIPLRIGIHEGEVVFEGGDVLGDGVNIASRLEQSAEEGCIYVSGAIYKDIRNKPGIISEFIEEKTLKNVQEPVNVYRVQMKEQDNPKVDKNPSIINKRFYYFLVGFAAVFAAIFIWQILLKKEIIRSKDPYDKSIAVLPFLNDSPDQENEYFCNGMVEEILTHLQKIEDLRVKSRTDIERYRDQSHSTRDIGNELKVSFILEGSVRKAGNNLRITAQLIEVKTGDHLWAETYDGLYTEKLFEFQSEVAKKVAASLKAMITPAEKEQLERKPTTNMMAHDLCMRGNEIIRKWWYTRDNTDLRVAMNLFNQALKMDPEFVDPLRGKAMAFYQMGRADSALFYFDRIIELSPDSHGAYLGKGMVYMFTNRPDSAYQYIAKGYELVPNDPSANLLFAQYYRFARNDYLKALPFFHRAYELGGESAEICGNIGHIYWTLGLYSFAEKYYNQAMGLSQECLFISHYSLILEFQKKYEEGMHFLDSICAIRTCRDLCEINKFRIAVDRKAFDQAEEYYSNIQSIDGRLNDYEKIYLGYFYKNKNKEMEADSLLRSIRNSLEKLLPGRRTYAVIWLSAIHAVMIDKENSLKYLAEAIDKDLFISLMDFAQSCPLYENVWEDPDFNDLVKRAQDKKAAIRDQVLEMVQRGEINL